MKQRKGKIVDRVELYDLAIQGKKFRIKCEDGEVEEGMIVGWSDAPDNDVCFDIGDDLEGARVYFLSQIESIEIIE